MHEEEEEEESFDGLPHLSGALTLLATGGGISHAAATSTTGAKLTPASLTAKSVFVWERADKVVYPPLPEGFSEEPERPMTQS